MVDILERMNEYEVALESKNKKDFQEKATAEDMRKKATERVGETRRRHSIGNDEITLERK